MNMPQQFGLQGRGGPFWMRSISVRRVGIMVLILALLFTIVSTTLYAVLNYPAILLDTASLANSLGAQGEIVVLLGFIGLLLCGVLLVVVSLSLAPHLEEKRRRRAIVTGRIRDVLGGWCPAGAGAGAALEQRMGKCGARRCLDHAGTC